MSDIASARRTSLAMTINGADVTSDINKRLISLVWTDEEDEAADDLSVVLLDRDNVVAGTWLASELENRANANLNGGTKVTLSPTLTQQNWTGGGKDISLCLGKFVLDTVTVSGGTTGQRVTMQATAGDLASSFRNTAHTKGWESTTLKTIASSLAKSAGYNLLWLVDGDVSYSRREQVSDTDYSFLQKLCTAAGLSLKITGGAVVVFSQKEYESKASDRTITRGDKTYTSYNLEATLSDTCYSACTVSYDDTNSGETIEYTYTPSGYTYDEDNVLKVTGEKVSTTAEAKTLAIAKLREANKGAMTATFTFPGDLTLLAGLTVTLSGFGGFDGNYIIETGTHTVSSSTGYTTRIDLRKVITSY